MKNKLLSASKIEAMNRIIASYRQHILIHFPNKKFESEWILGCSVDEFALYLEQGFGKKMNWENYRVSWIVINDNVKHREDLLNIDQFYKYFRFDSWSPVLVKDAPNWLKFSHRGNRLVFPNIKVTQIYLNRSNVLDGCFGD